MQAVILSGGQGTRLRPLTSTMPKPAVPMVNRPMLWYMVDWLARHGVEDIVMSVGFLADGLRAALDETGHEGVNIRYVDEPEPLGTAGAIKYAEQHLDERFLVLNGDILTDFDISAEIAQHESTGARATLALVPVDDPTAYGLVLTDSDQRVLSFLEKPSVDEVPPNPRINAGAYVLERDVMDLIPTGKAVSFEREVFPALIDNGIYGYDADGYWLDLGTPERYVEATRDLLANNLTSWLSPELNASGSAIAASARTELGIVRDPVAVDENVTVDAGATIGAYSVVGPDVSIGSNAALAGSVLMRGCSVGEGVDIAQALIGPGVSIGAGARIESDVVIGEGATIDPGARIAAGSRIDAKAAVTA
ncbi:MAG: sugar phosphate nucleotidyltransferase [Solirubrobacterales bacterium]